MSGKSTTNYCWHVFFPNPCQRVGIVGHGAHVTAVWVAFGFERNPKLYSQTGKAPLVHKRFTP